MLGQLRSNWRRRAEVSYTSVEAQPNHTTAESFNPDFKHPESNEVGLSFRQKLHTNWNPPFLRTWTLVGFALFFALVIAALQIIFSVSEHNQGISTTDDGKYYLWTYGPTAVFVLTTILWRQVDYAAKSIQPWAELAKGPKSAENTLLLDYVTPFQPVAAYQAFRKRHFAVFATILVFFLIKVMTIVSTGVFSLRSVQEGNKVTTMVLQDTFDRAADVYHSVASVDSRSTYIVYGNLAYNVSLPAGTADKFAVQSFLPLGAERNGSLTYTANVDVFYADLDCERGNLTYNNSFSLANGITPVASYYNSTVVTSDCEVRGAILDAPDWYFVQDKRHRFGYYSSVQNVTCTNKPLDDPSRQRYMIAAAYSEGFSQNNNSMVNSSNIVCSPRYNIQSAKVTIDTLGNVRNVQLSGDPTRQIIGVTGLDVAQAVIASTKASNSLYFSNDEMVLDVFMNLLVQASPDFRPEDLLDPNFLEMQSRQLYGKLAAQFANLYLLAPVTSQDLTVQGSASLTRNRLFAIETPIRWMQGIAAVMILSVLLVILTCPKNVVPRSVDSITAVAAILARSPELESQLRGSGHLSLEGLRQILSGNHFVTVIDGPDDAKIFRIRKLKAVSEPTQISEQKDNNIKTIAWIRPLILHRLAILSTIVVSVAVIIVCEVLLFESNKNQGLTNVTNDAASRYSWLYIPVLVFVLLGALFNVMDFEIEFSESYHALSRGFCDAPSSMLLYPLRNISLYTSWKGLKHSRFALTAGSLSSILAPFLTIVVAGLFHTTSLQQNQPITANALDFFNLSGSYNANNAIPALVIEGNMSYPKWTFDELAFPHLQLGTQDFEMASTDGLISINTPAVRARVDCSVFPLSQIIETTFRYSGYLSVNISTPDGCGNMGYLDNPNEFLSMDIEVPDSESGYFGFTSATGFQPSCPTIAIFFGRVLSNRLDGFNVLACTQSIERLDVNATFSSTDMSISSTYPPQTYENTTMNFSTYYDGFPQLQTLNITNSNISTDSKFDSITNAMVYGRDGAPPAELLDPQELINSFTHFYRQYMAQSLNANFRANFSSFPELNTTVSVANPLHGTYLYSSTDSSHLRLVQSPLSTHILVGVLGALLLCALTIYLTVDIRKVFPKPVGSIAAVASLLAGSRIVDPNSGLIPQGAEWWSDAEWEKRGIWNSEMFRMGWWDQFRQPVDSWDEKFDSDLSEDGTLSARNGDPVFMIDARSKTVA